MTRPLRTVVAAITVALAVAAPTACSPAPPPGEGSPAQSAAASGGPSPAPGGVATVEQRGLVGGAHRGALALVALGSLAQERGAGQDVRGLGGEVAGAGRAIDEQVRAFATERGIVLGDQIDAQTQAMLEDLQARAGGPFDQAWLRAVLDLQQQARAPAEAVLAAPDASRELKDTMRDGLARLDAAVARLQTAAESTGTQRPTCRPRCSRPVARPVWC
ncbi:MAG TPA: DUF4142 domain-containing protein [Pseudonocardia sp.]|nr:DUF4142 domain-containing protein [Pseudonocardia sp.]